MTNGGWLAGKLDQLAYGRRSEPGQAEDLQEVAEVSNCVIWRAIAVNLNSLIGIEHHGR